jgi:predicted DNA-binding transcriptional regulator YafY
MTLRGKPSAAAGATARPNETPMSRGAFALNNKTAKVHRLVHLLQDASPGMSIRHMAASLGVDERTVKRYLSDIRRLKFDLVQERPTKSRPAAYRIRTAGTPPTHFVPGLKKIRAELHAGGNPKHSPLISQLIRFLEERDTPSDDASSPGASRDIAADLYHIDHGPFAEADPPPGILKIIEAAIVARTALRISYAGLSRGGEFLFFPYILSLRVGTLYLIGREAENRGPFKSLSVKRIKRCLATPDTFKPDAFNAAEFYKYTFGQWTRQPDEAPETVQLALRAPWLEKFLAESHFNPPGKILRKGDETIFELKMAIKPDFINWIMSLLPDLLPLSPSSLSKEVTGRLTRAIDALR